MLRKGVAPEPAPKLASFDVEPAARIGPQRNIQQTTDRRSSTDAI
jgi:hypothetical protein